MNGGTRIINFQRQRAFRPAIARYFAGVVRTSAGDLGVTYSVRCRR
jgi:hypothetical protein